MSAAAVTQAVQAAAAEAAAPAPPLDLVRLLVVGAVLAAALILGLVVQRLLTSRLRVLARRTSAAWDDLLVMALRGFVVLWLILAGLAVGLRLLPLRPEALRIAQHALGVLVILSGVVFLTRLARKAIYIYVDRMVEVPTSIFKNFATILIYLVGFLVALDYLGVRIAPLLTALGIGGLAVALALQDTMSNLFAGLNILMTRKIRPGDYIRLDSGEEGIVCDITWRNTTVSGPDNNMIVVPNSKLGAAIVTNTHLPEKAMGLFVPVTVAFDNDLAHVERVTLEVAREVLADPQWAVPGFEPAVRYNAFTDLGARFNVVLRIKEYRDQYAFRHDFLKRLHARYRAEGIKLAVPPRAVTVDKAPD